MTDHRFNSRVCLIYFNYFNGSTPTQTNDFVLICIKIMVMVKEPDEKPAAVINQGTLEGVVHFYDH